MMPLMGFAPRLWPLLFWSIALLGSVPAWLWLLGRVFNDRWHPAQYCYWLPTHLSLVWLAASACLLTLIFALTPGRARVQATSPVPARQKRSRRAYAVAIFWLAVLLMFLWACHEYRLYRYLGNTPTPASTFENPRALRILAWNPAIDYMDDFADRVQLRKADILAITNRPGHTKWEQLRDHVGGARSMARFGRLTIISHYRIVRWGGCALGITGARKRTTLWQGGGEVSQDSGEAFFVELDTTAQLGRTFTLWMIDIPSDLALHRARVFEQAAATLTSFPGPCFGRSDANLDVLLPLEPGGGNRASAFPPPDLIVGDFNTPRGSRSIRTLVGDLPHAFDAAGRGLAGTWRRDFPLVFIDQTYVARWLTPRWYNIIDMGAGQHRAQWMQLERVE